MRTSEVARERVMLLALIVVVVAIVVIFQNNCWIMCVRVFGCCCLVF